MIWGFCNFRNYKIKFSIHYLFIVHKFYTSFENKLDFFMKHSVDETTM